MAFDDFTLTIVRGVSTRLDFAVLNGASAQNLTGWTDVIVRGKASQTASDVDALLYLSLANSDVTVDSASGGTAHVTVPGSVTQALGNKAKTIYAEVLGVNAAGSVFSLSRGQLKVTPNAAGGKVFVPNSLPGLKAWLRADQKVFQDINGASPAITDNAPVASWRGTGSASHAFVQGRTTRYPHKMLAALNGLPVIRGDGATTFLEGPYLSTFIAPAAFTMFLVAKATSGAGSGAVATWPALFADDNQTLMVGVGATQVGVSHQTASAVDEVKANWTLGTYGVIKVMHDTGVLSVSVNGGTAVTANSGNTTLPGGITVLHSQCSLLGGNAAGIASVAGDLGELLIWDVALSSGDSGKVATYLTKRWATPPVHAVVTLH